jgi:hypothetical protein
MSMDNMPTVVLHSGLSSSKTTTEPTSNVPIHAPQATISALPSFIRVVYPVRPPKQTLTVPSGSEMVFRFGGQKSTDKVEISVTPRDEYGKLSASADSNLSRSLKALGSGVERTIPVELPPREYVVSVYVEVSQPFNQTDYFFRVMVE